DMGGGAIAQLNLDLDSEMHDKDAVVFDVRNNNGGFVNGAALDVLQRSPYVNMVRRGVPSVPGRPVLGQRALERPTILITSQATLSDGENFTEGYRTMKLGTVVGEPTAQWGVYTGGGPMVDGAGAGRAGGRVHGRWQEGGRDGRAASVHAERAAGQRRARADVTEGRHRGRSPH